jgi:hypothetical protein
MILPEMKINYRITPTTSNRNSRFTSMEGLMGPKFLSKCNWRNEQM